MLNKILRLIIVSTLVSLLLIQSVTVSAQTPTICGYSTDGVLQSGMTGYPYPYIIVCSTGEKIAWGNLGGWGMAKYVRIYNPVIVDISPVQLNDGTVISKKIQSWEDYSEISNCNACGQGELPSPPSSNVPSDFVVVCGQVMPPPPANCPPDSGGCGNGEIFIPYGSENNPEEWISFHPLGVYVRSRNDYFWLGDLVGYNQPVRLMLSESELADRLVIEIEDYEVVDSCALLPTPTPTITHALPDPDIEITNFTLADTLRDFSQSQESVILKPNVLWIQITNVGQGSFYPSPESGKYIVQVVLKKTGSGKIEEYDYASGQSGLKPLGSLDPGDSVVVYISDLFFFTPVDNAELEVFLSPDPSLGMKDSILSKPITVRDHPDTFLRCAGTIAQSVIKVAKAALPQYRAALNSTDLAVRMVKCSFNGDCVAKETAKWLLGLVIGSIQDIGQVLTIGADALLAMGENGPPPCIKVTDWLNAYLHEAIRNKFNVNGIAAESPVYPLVTNEAGQRAGVLENGQIVEEIPGSKVVVIGEQRFILYPGSGVSQLSIAGYAEGKMNLYATYAQEPGQGISIRYSDVTITQGMIATLDSSDTQYKLKIDINGDGSIDQSLLPNEILTLTESGVSQQPIVTSTVVPTPTVLPTETPLPQQPKGICGSVFGLFALPILVIWIQRRGRDK